MIQKVGLTITKNNSNKITKITRKYVATSKNSFRNLIQEEGQAISKVKRFFTELTDEIKANFRKFSQKEELPKTNKVKKSNISYNAKTKEELEIERKQRVVVEMRARDAEEQIKKAGHSVSSGDIDQHGYLTSSGKHKVEHPTFKGLHDDLDFEETVRKELSHNDNGIGLDDVEHSYNDIIIRNHSTDIVEHETEPSLIKALKHNHEHNITETDEQIVQDALEHIDDLTEHLFG